MPWRRRTITPLSHRGHVHSETTRPSLKVEACRIPAWKEYSHQPLWPLLALNDEAREKLVKIELLGDAWLVRWPGETEAIAMVVAYNPWPDGLAIRLHDLGRIEEEDTGILDDHRPVLAVTRHSASATWGGSPRVGFLQLADDIWRERERVAAPDIDALMSIAR